MDEEIVAIGQVDLSVEVHDSIAEPCNRSQVSTEDWIDDARLLNQVERFRVRRRDAQVVGGTDVRGNFDGGFDRELESVEHRILPLSVLEEVRFGNCGHGA